jgi:hypothetical protein
MFALKAVCLGPLNNRRYSRDEHPHALLWGIHDCIGSGATNAALQKWRHTLLSASTEFCVYETEDELWTRYFNDAEALEEELDVLANTELNKICAVWSLKCYKEESLSKALTAKAVYELLLACKIKQSVNSDEMNLSWVDGALTVASRGLSIAQVHSILRRLDDVFGRKGPLDSCNKMDMLFPKKRKEEHTIWVFPH